MPTRTASPSFPSPGSPSPASSTTPSPALRAAIATFGSPRGYLAAASMGLPSVPLLERMHGELDAWRGLERDPVFYAEVAERTRALYAKLVSVPVDRVAIGSQTSVFAGLIASSVPAGAEVLCVEGDFSSMVFPFLQRPDITVRHVAGETLAAAITDRTWLVAFSLVQSATGAVADAAAIREAAARHGARTFCDTTQATGVLPVDARLFDATVCHSYKWLCAPRGAAFLTVSESFQDELTPTFAGWYAGEKIWASCYGPAMQLASDARRFDVSPAWPAWVGAEVALGMFAELDIAEIWEHSSGLGNQLCDRLGLERQNQAIVTWADPEGEALARVAAAGIKATGRAGRLRTAFHLWNTEEDVAAVVAALR
jgi:selenocysteine lyase/cysteine desulfurase